MPPPNQFTTYVLELLYPLGGVTARRMFGGAGLFQNGTMFALIASDELYFKVADANRPAYEAAGESPFTYETKNGTNTLASYWRCPPDLLEDAETFHQWAREAIDAALASAITARQKPKTRSRGAPPGGRNPVRA